MKKNLTLFLLLLSATVLFSCKKNESIPAESTLNGSWELRSVLGIQVPGVSPNYQPGNGNVYVFNNGNYTIYMQGKIVDSGTYTIEKDIKPINNNTSTHSITLVSKMNSRNDKLYLKLGENSLVIFDGVIAADGIEGTYERLSLQL